MSPEPVTGSPSAAAGTRRLRIVHIYPHLLGTYGDGGNATVLRRRAADRGIDTEVVLVQPGEPVPGDGDIYLLGGGEDAKQTAAAQALRADGTLARVAADGAVVLGICAGYQLLGRTFLGVGGVVAEGLGLLDVETDRLARRAVGNVLAEPAPGLGLPALVGFENHGGATALGPGARPLAQVRIGVGNGAQDRSEGAVQGEVYGTYLHGPVLALNPALADRLIAARVGALEPLDDELCERLRTHRLQEVLPRTARAGRRRDVLAVLRGGQAAGPSGEVAQLSSSGR